MEFIRQVIKNRNLILKMGASGLKNKFSSTTLGTFWGFIQPIIFMLTYIFVFKYIMKAADSDGYPFITWILPAIAMWNFINDAIMSISSSIRGYGYLVKKVIFPIDIIPVISFVSTFIIQGTILIVVLVICMFYGVFPNIIQLLYILFAAICFIMSFTRLTAAVTTLVPDFGQLLTIAMQLLFWFTPVLWNTSMLGDRILSKILKCSPFAYIITGVRETFLGKEYILSNGYQYTVIFWMITLILFVYGNYVFKKSKKEFADVI